MSGHRVDRLAKASIGSRVVLGGLLALAVVVLVNWLAGRPGMRLPPGWPTAERPGSHP